MEAFYVSLVLFVSRAWDAVSDPLIGYLVGRSPWTRIGKLTPWLVHLKRERNPRWWWWGGGSAQQIFVLQAGPVHSARRPVLPAAVVCAPGVGGGRRALVPCDHLPV